MESISSRIIGGIDEIGGTKSEPESKLSAFLCLLSPSSCFIPPAQSPGLPLPNIPIALARLKAFFPEMHRLSAGQCPVRHASIAVLSFTNMSGDPQQEYFSDGITQTLSSPSSLGSPDFFVIARNSSFTYKGKAAKVQDVGRELGVKYVLKGRIQKSGNQVRLNVPLLEARADPDPSE